MYLETKTFALSLDLTILEETTKLAVLEAACAVANRSFFALRNQVSILPIGRF